MDYMQKEAIRKMTAQLPQQELHKIISILTPLEKELCITVSNSHLTINRKTMKPSGSIPLNKIHAVMMTNTHVFVICCNEVIHSFDRRIGKYEVILPDNEEPGFWEMFRMMCRSYMERWKNEK